MNQFTPQQLQQIKQIVQQEMKTNVFRYPKVQTHYHNGVDSPHISQGDVTPGTRINSGTIEFAQAQTFYTLGIKFNPTSIFLNGVAVNNDDEPVITKKAICNGAALLGGSYYLAPSTPTSVTTATQKLQITQSSAGILFDLSGASPVFDTCISQADIFDIYDSNAIYARLKVKSYSNNGIILYTEYLQTGWQIYANFVIT